VLPAAKTIGVTVTKSTVVKSFIVGPFAERTARARIKKIPDSHQCWRRRVDYALRMVTVIAALLLVTNAWTVSPTLRSLTAPDIILVMVVLFARVYVLV